MKIAVLTTQTLHHAKFVQDMAASHPDMLCVMETTSVTAPFDTAHPFEKARDAYETELFFNGREKKVSDLAESVFVTTINDPEAQDTLEKFSPDLLIDFGTRKVGKNLIGRFDGKILNLHGGDPEQYRGLDTHLWAIYHNDFDNLVTTLHYMNTALDDGAIVAKTKLDVSGIADLARLRAVNTQACIDMCLDAVKSLQDKGAIPGKKQTDVGRYYSFMPTVLKEVCVHKFRKHQSSAKREAA